MARPKRKPKAEPEEELLRAVSQLGKGMIGSIRVEAGPAFSGRTRLRVRGLNVEAEKEKVSLTLDRDLIEALRTTAGPKRLSATVNDLLMQGIERAQLRALIEALEEEKGPASPGAYQQLLEEWFGDAD